MIFGLEIGMLIGGLIALLTGKLSWSKTRSVTGAPARLAGLVWMAPLPLAFAVGFLLGSLRVFPGRVPNREAQAVLALMEAAIAVACLLAGVLLCLISADRALRRPAAEDPLDEEEALDGVPIFGAEGVSPGPTPGTDLSEEDCAAFFLGGEERLAAERERGKAETPVPRELPVPAPQRAPASVGAPGRPSPTTAGWKVVPFEPVFFSLVVQHDPHWRFRGRFEAVADAEGIRFWRGGGRQVPLARGTEARHLGGNVLEVAVEGRLVKLAVLVPEGKPGRLSRDLAAFLRGERDTVLPPVYRPWYVFVPALALMALPFLSLLLGAPVQGSWPLLWGGCSFALAALALLLALPGRRPVARAPSTVALAVLGYLVLLPASLVNWERLRASGPSREAPAARAKPREKAPSWQQLGTAGRGYPQSGRAAVSPLFGRDGRSLIVTNEWGSVRVLDLESGAERQKIGVSNWKHQITQTALSPRADLLAVALASGRVELVDLERGVLCKPTLDTGPSGYVWCVAFSPDGNLLASGHSNGEVKVCDVANRKLRKTLANGDGAVVSVAFSGDGRHLAVGAEGRHIKVWEVESGRLVSTSAGHDKGQGPWANASDRPWVLRSVEFSPDGRRLLSCSDDGSARLWDLPGAEERHRWEHEAPTQAAAFHPGGRLVATGCAAGIIRFWDSESGDECFVLRQIRPGRVGAREVFVHHLSFSPDGTQLAVALPGRTEVWDLAAAGVPPELLLAAGAHPPGR